MPSPHPTPADLPGLVDMDKGWMSDVEVATMVGFATLLSDCGARTINILEVGCFRGRTTSAFGRLVWAKTWCVDNFRGPTDEPEMEVAPLRKEFEDNLRAVGAHRNVIIKQGNSAEVMATLPPDYFDLVLIDADHSEPGVRADVKAAWPLLKEGGYMFFDDVNRESVIDGFAHGFTDLGYGPQLSVYNVTVKVGYVRKVGGAPKTSLDYLPPEFKDVRMIK